tara:strand:- start:5912 stop:6658 length:747 start_codon:yes stop_codon:yes gene_type:complete
MENKQQFPTEEVTLPSKGLLYPEDSPLRKGVIEMKYMTAKEEDILTNQNYISKGTVIDKLLQSLIITPIDYDTLLAGDKNAILIAARVLGYGADYEFEYKGDKIEVDLSSIKDKYLDESLVIEGKNEFAFTLPTAKREITFKFLTHADEKKIALELKGLKKLNKNSSNELTTRMKHIIVSVDGNTERKHIRNFVDNEFLARDARELRKYTRKIQPDVDLTFHHEDRRGNPIELVIPVGINFFWPDADV